jgi:hypothetical protein
MSNLRTPGRLNCGLIVPGIDTTKSSLEHPGSILSYGGLHTPPQSAHESRRPLLQYSSMMDQPYSASSSSFEYSHPSTPVHHTNPGNHGMVSAFSECAHTHLDQGSAVSTARRASHYPETVVQPPFEPQPSFLNAGYPDTTPQVDHESYSFGVGSNLTDPEGWRTSQQQAMSTYNNQPTYLNPTLFPASHCLTADSSPTQMTYQHLSSPTHHDQQLDHTYGTALQGYHSYAHAPQVIVPSQLSPQDDFSSHSWTEYAHEHPVSAISASSFGSLGPDAFDHVDHLEYDMLDDAPRLQDKYFADSEDDEGYALVKPERTSTPSKCSSSRFSTATNRTNTSMRMGRSNSKRLRAGAKDVEKHKHSYVSQQLRCLVQYEGPGFRLDRNGNMTVEPASSKKPHVCRYIKDDGTPCDRRFERSEHLKRHNGMHSDVKKYPCPLPKCNKRIQRPDNATDHFKTHLRPKTKGKRNEHFDWPTVEHALRDEYDQRTAQKLVTNLERWIGNGMPEASAPRR